MMMRIETVVEWICNAIEKTASQVIGPNWDGPPQELQQIVSTPQQFTANPPATAVQPDTSCSS